MATDRIHAGTPEGWRNTPLRELCLKTEINDPAESPHRSFQYVDVSSVSNKLWKITSSTEHTGSTAPSRARKLVRANDVIFATVRPTLKRIALVPDHLDGQIVSTAFCVLRANPLQADPYFIYYWLLTDEFADRMTNLQRGASYPAVSDGNVLEHEIAVPPLPEQRAIAAVLSEIQAAVEVQEKIVARLKELKAATMAKVFHEGLMKGLMFDSNVFDDLIDGRLHLAALPNGVKIYVTHIQRDELGRTPDDCRRAALQTVLRDVSESQIPTSSFVLDSSHLDEAEVGDGDLFQAVRGRSLKNTNDALIAETAVKKRLVLVTNEKNLRKRVRAVGGESISRDDLLAGRLRPMKQTEIGEIPESWEVVRLGEIAERITKGSSPNWQGFDYCNEGALFVRSQNVGLGELLLSETVYVPQEFNRKERRSVLSPGDVLINIVGASIGRAAVADARLNGANINQAVALVRLSPGRCNPTFLAHFLISRAGLEQMHRQKKEIARANLSLEDVGSFLVPVPVRDEQDEIAESLERTARRVRGTEGQRNLLKSLFSSMLHLLMTGRVRVTSKMIALQRVADRARRRKRGTGTVDEKLLKEIVRRIVEAVAPEKIILFGSAARGEMGPDSDLDLLIVKSGVHRLATAQMIEHSLMGIPIPTDIVVATPKDIEVHKDTIGLIYRPALQEGKILYAA